MSKKSESREITFILPCAGEGKRLGYCGHKELYPIEKDRYLIDYSLEHVNEAVNWTQKYADLDVKVVVVIRPWKTEVYDYVKSHLATVNVKWVYFDDKLFEWPGSVHSARSLYSDYNMVLLPDSYLSLSKENITRDLKGRNLAELAISELERTSAVFGYMRCNSPDRLKSLGALKVEQSKTSHGNDDESAIITYFQDKPDRLLQKYNGYWCCYGFREEVGDELYKYLSSSVKKTAGNIEHESFHPAGAFQIQNYLDLGTPENIERFRLL